MKNMLALAALGLAATAMSVPTQAKVPNTMDAVNDMIGICAKGTDIILAGKGDDAEAAYFDSELRKRGWTDPGDRETLLKYCIAFKQGYLKRMREDNG